MTVTPAASYAFSTGQQVVVRNTTTGLKNFAPVLSYSKTTGVLVLGVSERFDTDFWNTTPAADEVSVNLSGLNGVNGLDGEDGATGATGVTGTIIFSGATDPNVSTTSPSWAPYAGRIGDFYISTTDGWLYLRTL
jgi:hypothetical protein